MRRRCLLPGSLLALACLALAGCGGHGAARVGAPGGGAPGCTNQDVDFSIATFQPANSGESSVYVRVRNRAQRPCTVDGYPTVRVAAHGSGTIVTRSGGDPAMHSPAPRRLVVRPRQSVFFGIGWHTTPPPGSLRGECADSRAVLVSLVPNGATTLPVGNARVCPSGRSAGQPYVAVSALLPADQFADANP